MENQTNTNRSGRIPFWLIGFLVCFIIFLVSTIYVGSGLENAYKSANPDPNIDLGYHFPWLAINVVLLPIIFIIFIIVSFFQRKNVVQFKIQYVAVAIILIIIAVGILYSLQYLFPVTYEANAEACAMQHSQILRNRCYERNAIKNSDKSLCDKIDNGYRNSDPVTEQIYIQGCYDNVARGHW